MAGFVECLDNEEAEEGTEREDGDYFPFSLFFFFTVTDIISSASSFILNSVNDKVVQSISLIFRCRSAKESGKNPSRNPDPHPEPAHHLPGAEGAQPGALPSGI